MPRSSKAAFQNHWLSSTLLSRSSSWVGMPCFLMKRVMLAFSSSLSDGLQTTPLKEVSRGRMPLRPKNPSRVHNLFKTTDGRGMRVVRKPL